MAEELSLVNIYISLLLEFVLVAGGRLVLFTRSMSFVSN